MKSTQISFIMVALLLAVSVGCDDAALVDTDSFVIVEEPINISGSWVGGFINNDYMRGGEPRRDSVGVELTHKSDDTLVAAGMVEYWYYDDVDYRSYVSGTGVFVDPYLTVNMNSFKGLISLRGRFMGESLVLMMNGRHEITLNRR